VTRVSTADVAARVTSQRSALEGSADLDAEHHPSSSTLIGTVAAQCVQIGNQ